MKTLISILIILLTFTATIHGQSLSPVETVELWNRCYGTAEMDQCGDITTANMREHKPKAVWVYDTWKQLDKIGYRKETSEIIQQKIDAELAMILVQSRIYALDGYVDQKELFTLVNSDGTWLIDELVVGDEILEEEQQEPL